MLTVRPHGTFTTGFDLVDEARGPVGTLAGSAWREGGRIRAGDREWEFRRSGGRRFALVGADGELATARRTSMWSGTWQVTAGDRSYELAKPSMWGTRYELRESGRVVGELTRRGVFRSRTEMTLPADLPPAFQVFVVAVVLTQWRRDQSATGGAAAAAS